MEFAEPVLLVLRIFSGRVGSLTASSDLWWILSDTHGGSVMFLPCYQIPEDSIIISVSLHVGVEGNWSSVSTYCWYCGYLLSTYCWYCKYFQGRAGSLTTYSDLW